MESHLRRHEKSTATTSNLAYKKINPEVGDCTFLQSATLQRQYTYWVTPPFRKATYGILCQVHLKHVVGMST